MSIPLRRKFEAFYNCCVGNEPILTDVSEAGTVSMLALIDLFIYICDYINNILNSNILNVQALMVKYSNHISKRKMFFENKF